MPAQNHAQHDCLPKDGKKNKTELWQKDTEHWSVSKDIEKAPGCLKACLVTYYYSDRDKILKDPQNLLAGFTWFDVKVISSQSIKLFWNLHTYISFLISKIYTITCFYLCHGNNIHIN